MAPSPELWEEMFGVLAAEIEAKTHAYQGWPGIPRGDDCNMCTARPGHVVHRTVEYLLVEAGIIPASKVYDPSRGYHHPDEADAIKQTELDQRSAKKEARKQDRETSGATPWRKTSDTDTKSTGATPWTTKRKK